MLQRTLPLIVFVVLVAALASAASAAVRPEPSCPRVSTSGCANTELTPTVENLHAVRESTLCLINQERARNEVLPLQVDPELEKTAEAHSEQMVSEDYFEHTTPNGETVLQRLQAVGYVPANAVYMVGENIAWGTLNLATPEAIVEAWIASPSHLANILEGSFQDTGIGVDPAAPETGGEGELGATYTEDFGVVEDSSAAREHAGKRSASCARHQASRRSLAGAHRR